MIDGDRYSGKSHGIRFTIQCAPQDRFTAVDVVDFGDVVMNAADLAKAIDDGRSADFPAFDPTKEDEAVPRLLIWLTGKLRGSRRWIIVDHCGRANFSRPALILLTKLAGVIERGVLPGVRLVVAEIDRAKLPAGAHYDRAALPSEDAVGLWCETLGAHIGKPALTKIQISGYIATVFGSIAAGTAPDQHASLVEAGLAKVFGSLQEL